MSLESVDRYPDPQEPENTPSEAPANAARALWPLQDDLKAQIAAQAEAAYPNECCGFVIRRGQHARVFPVRNMSVNPRTEFHGAPEDIAAAEDEGELLMAYHSHPNLSPMHGPADKTDAERNQLPSLVMSWPSGDCEMYFPNGWKADLLGRPFVHGVLDCFALVKDRLAQDGIIIEEFEREDDWWVELKDSNGNLVRPHKDYYMDNFTKWGFRKVETLQPLDCILIQMPNSPVANHCAVYEGDGIMIHHPPGRISVRQPYFVNRGYYSKATRAIVRHESR